MEEGNILSYAKHILIDLALYSIAPHIICYVVVLVQQFSQETIAISKTQYSTRKFACSIHSLKSSLPLALYNVVGDG